MDFGRCPGYVSAGLEQLTIHSSGIPSYLFSTSLSQSVVKGSLLEAWYKTRIFQKYLILGSLDI